jgi:hypothetical protein
MAIKFTNNATATLAASISTSSTSLTVTTSQGALFPTLGAGDYFYATLVDSSNNIEIVKITARSGDTLTAVRAQESTTARVYAAADKLELRVTAAALTNFANQDGPNTFSAANTFSATNTFSGTNSFTGPAVAFTNVPTFGGGALPISNGGTSATSSAALTAVIGNLIFPVGAIYTATVATNPGTLLGFGTWVAFGAGRVMMGSGNASYLAGTTGGSADAVVPSHTHTNGTLAVSTTTTLTGNIGLRATGSTNTTSGVFTGTNDGVSYQGGGFYGVKEVSMDANHNHTLSGSIATAGVSPTDANLQPYIVVYMWQRTV